MTTRRSPLLFLLALGTLLLAFAGPVIATTEDAPAEPPAEETTVPADVPEPAVSIPEEAPAESTPEWTFRFLVPATLLIGGLAVIGTIVAYFVKVTRQRYRVVE